MEAGLSILYTGQYVGNYVIPPWYVIDIQIPLLQNNTPFHQPLALVFKFIWEHHGTVVCIYLDRCRWITKVNFKMTKG